MDHSPRFQDPPLDIVLHGFPLAVPGSPCYAVAVREVRNVRTGEKGRFRVELAKVTSKGQITIPVDIRRKLGVKEGDKVLFVEDRGRIYVMNSSMEALQKAQAAFSGEADRHSLRNEQDAADRVSALRSER